MDPVPCLWRSLQPQEERARADQRRAEQGGMGADAREFREDSYVPLRRRAAALGGGERRSHDGRFPHRGRHDRQ